MPHFASRPLAGRRVQVCHLWNGMVPMSPRSSNTQPRPDGSIRRAGRRGLAGAVLVTLAATLVAMVAYPIAASAAPAPIPLTSSQCPTDITQGESDGCVTELQNLLNKHGFSVSADGIF